MPTSVRLDLRTERLVEKLAREEGKTKSQVIRDAIVVLADRRKKRDRQSPRPYDLIAHLIGSVSGGPPDLSENTGKKFRQMLIERQRRTR